MESKEPALAEHCLSNRRSKQAATSVALPVRAGIPFLFAQMILVQLALRSIEFIPVS